MRNWLGKGLLLTAASGLVAAQAPAPPEPVRHIDDRTPARAEPAGVPVLVRTGVAIGSIDVDLGAVRLHDRERVWAWWASLEVDADLDLAPGVEFAMVQSGDSVFAGELFNDGQQVQPAAAELAAFTVFPYVAQRHDLAADVTAVWRVGAFVDEVELEHRFGAVQRTWMGYGVRAQWAPEWTFARGSDLDWQLTGCVGVELGSSRFREAFVGGSDRDSALRWGGEVGIGVCAAGTDVAVELGWHWRHVELGETVTALLGDAEAALATDLWSLQIALRF